MSNNSGRVAKYKAMKKIQSLVKPALSATQNTKKVKEMVTISSVENNNTIITRGIYGSVLAQSLMKSISKENIPNLESSNIQQFRNIDVNLLKRKNYSIK